MTGSMASANIDDRLRAAHENSNTKSKQATVASEQTMNTSISFRQANENVAALPTVGHSDVEVPTDDKTPREIKLYSAAQFRSHINRIYPFHLDYFTNKLSALDFEQHRMGLYMFYDVNEGHLINDLEKESSKKSDRGKNMKRMNGFLLNEHRMFNDCAKEYAVQHWKRDYEAMKSSINQFMQAWLQRKTDLLLQQTSFLEQYYSQRMVIPLNSYDSLSPVTFVNLSTVLRLGTIPLLTVPGNLDQLNVKCSDNHDRVITNRFNPNYRLSNLVDDPNLLAILSQHPSIDIVVSKGSFHQLIELFSMSTSSPMTLPVSIREFEVNSIDSSQKKKVIFIDKPLRQGVYTKRELNSKYAQRAFRSLLLSTTGGKREDNDNPFNYTSFNGKTDFQVTEIKKQVKERSVPQEVEKKKEEKEMTDDEDDEDGMVISTDGDIEEQQKLFAKSKQKIIHSAPVLQERETSDTTESGPVPVLSHIKLNAPVQGNYEYCLWQLGTLQILIRSSYHGFRRSPSSDQNMTDEYVTCYSKLEYQPQFGFEQITDKEYRSIWLESYLRHGASVLLGRINVFTQHLLKVEKMTYENIDRNLKECRIDMLKPLTKTYGLLYGLQSLEANNYLLSCPLNDQKLYLYQTAPTESEKKTFDLRLQPFQSNELLVQTDNSSVPWVPLTPTLLLSYHLDFERIPLTFCPRNKRCYDIAITIPPHRRRRTVVDATEKKKRRKVKKKKKAQQQKQQPE